jgi:hypothetical protein
MKKIALLSLCLNQLCSTSFATDNARFLGISDQGTPYLGSVVQNAIYPYRAIKFPSCPPENGCPKVDRIFKLTSREFVLSSNNHHRSIKFYVEQNYLLTLDSATKYSVSHLPSMTLFNPLFTIKSYVERNYSLTLDSATKYSVSHLPSMTLLPPLFKYVLEEVIPLSGEAAIFSFRQCNSNRRYVIPFLKNAGEWGFAPFYEEKEPCSLDYIPLSKNEYVEVVDEKIFFKRIDADKIITLHPAITFPSGMVRNFTHHHERTFLINTDKEFYTLFIDPSFKFLKKQFFLDDHYNNLLKLSKKSYVFLNWSCSGLLFTTQTADGQFIKVRQIALGGWSENMYLLGNEYLILGGNWDFKNPEDLSSNSRLHLAVYSEGKVKKTKELLDKKGHLHEVSAGKAVIYLCKRESESSFIYMKNDKLQTKLLVDMRLKGDVYSAVPQFWDVNSWGNLTFQDQLLKNLPYFRDLEFIFPKLKTRKTRLKKRKQDEFLKTTDPEFLAEPLEKNHAPGIMDKIWLLVDELLWSEHQGGLNFDKQNANISFKIQKFAGLIQNNIEWFYFGFEHERKRLNDLQDLLRRHNGMVAAKLLTIIKNAKVNFEYSQKQAIFPSDREK